MARLPINRRQFIKGSLLSTTAGALALSRDPGVALAAEVADTSTAGPALPQGKIKNLPVSRLLLGGNLLTHYTHSRDLRYVYSLAARYNTEAKILETLSLAEQHGVDTLVIHTVPETMRILQKHRKEQGGKIKWIVCPTAAVEGDLSAYRKAVDDLVRDGAEAIYLWGVRSDALVQQGKLDLIAKAVEMVKAHGLPSGVGAHDLSVIKECEKQQIEADFYIKTFHHHTLPTGPEAGGAERAYNEVPGYWCKHPEETIEVMRDVKKPWIAFKVMAAGAIPPQNAFRYAFRTARTCPGGHVRFRDCRGCRDCQGRPEDRRAEAALAELSDPPLFRCQVDAAGLRHAVGDDQPGQVHPPPASVQDNAVRRSHDPVRLGQNAIGVEHQFHVPIPAAGGADLEDGGFEAAGVGHGAIEEPATLLDLPLAGELADQAQG